jgi:RNA polymerase sigma factor (sigma-70 family)
MATQINEVVQQLRRAVLQQDGAGVSDGQLLGCFIENRDEAAVAALVRRHGPMVWGVCRRVLLDPHDAEDAFQATFLVLVRKAAAVRPREQVGNWLYGVARQTALKARAMRTKRRARERQVAVMPEPEVAQHDLQHDLQLVLDQELGRLPEKYRVAIVLCDLEGKTRKEAARQLGVPEGTLAARVARARTLLARRLTRQGVVLSGGVLALVLSRQAALACVPTSVVSATVKAATLVAAGRAESVGVVPANVAALAEGVLKSMLLTKLRIATVALLAAGALVLSVTRNAPTAVATAAGSGKAREVPRERSAREEARTVQVRITSPAGMTVSVLARAGQGPEVARIKAPGRLELEQGKLTWLRLADLPGRPGVKRFLTVEIPKADAATKPFVSICAIPIPFRDEDFDQVGHGNLVTKVVYLATRAHKETVRQGEPITLASYDLTEGDVIAEARRRGAILAVVRLGNIDLRAGEPRRAQTENRALKQRLAQVEREIKALRAALERQARELRSLQKAIRAEGK